MCHKILSYFCTCEGRMGWQFCKRCLHRGLSHSTEVKTDHPPSQSDTLTNGLNGLLMKISLTSLRVAYH